MKYNQRWSLIFIFLMILTGCNSNISEKPNTDKGTEKENPEEGYYNFVERDINSISINEENKITDKMSKSNRKILSMADAKNLNTNNNFVLLRTFNTQLPQGLALNLSYKKHLMPYDYFLTTKDNVKVYNMPSVDGNVVGEFNSLEKINLLSEVKGEYIESTKSQKWYAVTWEDNDLGILYGFVPNGSGEIRSFKFDTMFSNLKKLEDELNKGKYGYISNYRDANGSPPLMNNKGIDKYGVQAYQSAPAYSDLNNKKEFRYFPDGMIVFVQGDVKGYYKVKALGYEGTYWIPKEYVSFDNNIDKLTKAVVVDVTNQNQAVFEKISGSWNMVSYNLATTGVRSEKMFETPIGNFKVQEKKDKFEYLNDATGEIAGYAPYAIRFSQGGYIHGIPVEYVKKDGEKIDPGMKEELATLGTFPRSHKCVRNYTSHAKFLYNWVSPNDTSVIVFK
ncbi:MAG: L,D-transpeptidase [Tissierellaceae bacterium]|nr:L,D-transpeptidase [Tissierellaceae bacterium]